MELTKKNFEKIGNYIQEHLSEWLLNQSLIKPAQIYEIELRERIVRVEEEIKNLHELMKQGFEMMEKRFEQVDKRFEQMDRHLEQLDKRLFQFMIWSISFSATAAGIIIAVLKLS